MEKKVVFKIINRDQIQSFPPGTYETEIVLSDPYFQVQGTKVFTKRDIFVRVTDKPYNHLNPCQFPITVH